MAAMSATGRRNPAYSLYLLECRGNRFYAGIAIDVEARFDLHMTGKGAAFTRAHPPLRIIAQRQYRDVSEALKAEFAVKKLPKNKKIAFFSS